MLNNKRYIRKIQALFWIYITNNFIIKSIDDFKVITPAIPCEFIPINHSNCDRIIDFREEGRIQEYKKKLANGEIGFFAQHDGKVIGSIWASLNKSKTPIVVRTYMKLFPDAGLMHDGVTDPKWRGNSVGPFMVSRLASALIMEHGVKTIIGDVNIRNRSSLAMMRKLGTRIDHRMLSISFWGRLIITIKKAI